MNRKDRKWVRRVIWIVNHYASHLEERHLNLAANFANRGYRTVVITSSFHHAELWLCLTRLPPPGYEHVMGRVGVLSAISCALNTAGTQILVGDSWANPRLSGGLDMDKI